MWFVLLLLGGYITSEDDGDDLSFYSKGPDSRKSSIEPKRVPSAHSPTFNHDEPYSTNRRVTEIKTDARRNSLPLMNQLNNTTLNSKITRVKSLSSFDAFTKTETLEDRAGFTSEAADKEQRKPKLRSATEASILSAGETEDESDRPHKSLQDITAASALSPTTTEDVENERDNLKIKSHHSRSQSIDSEMSSTDQDVKYKRKLSVYQQRLSTGSDQPFYDKTSTATIIQGNSLKCLLALKVFSIIK